MKHKQSIKNFKQSLGSIRQLVMQLAAQNPNRPVILDLHKDVDYLDNQAQALIQDLQEARLLNGMVQSLQEENEKLKKQLHENQEVVQERDALKQELEELKFALAQQAETDDQEMDKIKEVEEPHFQFDTTDEITVDGILKRSAAPESQNVKAQDKGPDCFDYNETDFMDRDSILKGLRLSEKDDEQASPKDGEKKQKVPQFLQYAESELLNIDDVRAFMENREKIVGKKIQIRDKKSKRPKFNFLQED